MSETAKKVTAPGLAAMKAKGEKIVCITAYDYPSGLICDRAGVDVVLVGDSLGNVIQGHKTTLPVTTEEVAYHVRATRNGVSRALLVADMPFGSYGGSVAQCVDSAVALMRAGGEAVKLEGPLLEEVKALVRIGIPVMGHLGLTPQSVHHFGGFKVQGRDEAGEALLESAIALEHAGAFALVLEVIPAALAARISQAISIPTIGIGAGVDCDGEIQVLHDVLGLFEFKPRHSKPFVDGLGLFTGALSEYATAVRAREFPGPEQSV